MEMLFEPWKAMPGTRGDTQGRELLQRTWLSGCHRAMKWRVGRRRMTDQGIHDVCVVGRSAPGFRTAFGPPTVVVVKEGDSRSWHTVNTDMEREVTFTHARHYFDSNHSWT